MDTTVSMQDRVILVARLYAVKPPLPPLQLLTIAPLENTLDLREV